MIEVVSIASLKIFGVFCNAQPKGQLSEDVEIEQKLLILVECRPLLVNAFFFYQLIH